MTTIPRNLDQLLDLITSHGLGDRAMTHLPTFGGEEPASTHGVFSWDATRLLIQTAAGWKIVPRE